MPDYIGERSEVSGLGYRDKLKDAISDSRKRTAAWLSREGEEESQEWRPKKRHRLAASQRRAFLLLLYGPCPSCEDPLPLEILWPFASLWAIIPLPPPELQLLVWLRMTQQKASRASGTLGSRVMTELLFRHWADPCRN